MATLSNRRSLSTLKPVIFATLVAAAACGESKDSDPYEGPGFQSTGSEFSGILFAVVDKDFSSSQILFNDFAYGDVTTVTSGESGDPFVRWVDGKAYLFNRTETSLNYRTFDPRQKDPGLGTQTATPEAAVGDPHDVYLLGAGRMLLAQYSKGKIIVIDPATGALKQTVEASWDLGTGADAQLRPDSFLVKDAAGGGKDIYVLHQGLDAKFTVNGTQQVFKLHDDGTTVTAVDLDAKQDKVQGIALPIKSPAGFFTTPNGAELVYGECNSFDGADCKSGFVRLDLEKNTAELILDTKGHIGNGGVAQGLGDVFYALMAKGTEQESQKVIAKVDFISKTISDFYTFKNTRGCCSLTYDRSASTLYTGDVDAKDPNAGLLLAFPDGQATPTEVSLPGLPYGGLLVPK